MQGIAAELGLDGRLAG